MSSAVLQQECNNAEILLCLSPAGLHTGGPAYREKCGWNTKMILKLCKVEESPNLTQSIKRDKN